MKVVAVIQARLNSTRLPGKVLLPLPCGGRLTVLKHVITRLQKAQRVDSVVAATTVEPSDDAIEAAALHAGAACSRGSVNDVLSRCFDAAAQQQAGTVVRITADCPCIDPAVVDAVVEKHLSAGNDFTSNILDRTFPHGMDTEVMSFAAMQQAHQQATESYDREHVCPYIYRSRPEDFRIGRVTAPDAQSGPDIRLTLDTPQDYTLICAVFDQLYESNNMFTVEDIVSLFKAKPWLADINSSVVQKSAPASLNDELGQAVRLLDLQELGRASAILKAQIQ